ncbi:hypothetical protein FA13DRAFT_250395 [Coprinellus micaceus]|uniref:F-box domain-containing protein n=1 Tax=Coprinellus micaceus TaxID=71717 RepID=A0A4Y7TDY4_COPMI|nr:hypothetical protein FA13DRAFT_250395 [Coprinellus micaceus]
MGIPLQTMYRQPSCTRASQGSPSRCPKSVLSSNRLEVQLVQYRWALSPLRRLPLETVGEIIHIAVPDFREKGAQQNLVNYALVCKSWWLAALLNHKLWSRIHIHGPAYSHHDREAGKVGQKSHCSQGFIQANRCVARKIGQHDTHVGGRRFQGFVDLAQDMKEHTRRGEKSTVHGLPPV